MSSTDLDVWVTTSSAPGGIAVVELRGSRAAAALERLAPGRRFDVGRAVHTELVDGGETIDEAVVVARARGGFDLCVHGSPAVVARLVRALGTQVHIPRTPRDWAECARARLASVVGEAGARILVDQSEGALDCALAGLAEGPEPARAAAELAALGRAAASYLRPPRVVLAGAVNAGKSTLFNVLVGRARVLADARPGTTRDAVGEHARDGELVVEFVDTAGVRELAAAPDEVGEIEAQGQLLGRQMATSADLVLWCRSTTEDVAFEPPLDGAPVATLWTRADLAPAPVGAPAVASTVDAAGARRLVWNLVRSRLALPDAPWVAGRAVAIDTALVEALEAAARGGNDSVRRAALRGVFAPARRDSVDERAR